MKVSMVSRKVVRSYNDYVSFKRNGGITSYQLDNDVLDVISIRRVDSQRKVNEFHWDFRHKEVSFRGTAEEIVVKCKIKNQ